MKILLFIACLSCSILTIGQDSFSLKEAINYALTNHPTIKNANADIEIAEQKIWETTALGLPQISAKIDYQNFIDIPTTLIPAAMFNPMAAEGEMMGLQFGTKQNMTGSLQLSQLIFNGNYLVGLQAARTYGSLSSKIKEKIEQDVKESVCSAYYTLLVLKDTKVVLDSTIKTVEDLFDQTTILVNQGVIESTNAYQLELSVFQVKNAIAQIESQINVAKNLLKFNIGLPIEKEIDIKETLDEYILLAKTEEIKSFSASNNIDFQILESQLQMKELNLKNTKANYLPSIYGFMSHQRSAMRNEFSFFDGEGDWYPTTLVGISLEVPIFSSGQKKSQVNQAKLELEKTSTTLNQTDQGLKLQLSQALVEYQTAINTYDLLEKSTDVATHVLNNTITKFKEGVISSIELTQAHNQYLQVETDLVNAGFQLLNAKLKLNKIQNNL